MTDAIWKSKPLYPKGWATVIVLKSSPFYEELNARARSMTADRREYRWDDEGELYVAPTWVWK
jgi:hypothetical protein